MQGGGYQYEAQEVVNCLLAGKTQSERMPLAFTLGLMTLLDGIRAEWGLSYPMES
ncbi:hypothetical protein HC776_02285 [bacterium]|nr:hypothetical protein [bacterium]